MNEINILSHSQYKWPVLYSLAMPVVLGTDKTIPTKNLAFSQLQICQIKRKEKSDQYIYFEARFEPSHFLFVHAH
jgi:hypothetical protein